MDDPKLAVVKEEDGTYTGMCLCGYKTSFWPRQHIAIERVREHGREHVDGTPMSPISEFRSKHGLVVDNNMRAVFPEGARAVSMEDEEDE